MKKASLIFSILFGVSSLFFIYIVFVDFSFTLLFITLIMLFLFLLLTSMFIFYLKNNWNYWNNEIHLSFAQQLRLRRSFLNSIIVKSIDKNSSTGIYVGSNGEIYNTSNIKCSCSDFTKRKLPCKHMYHLVRFLNNDLCIPIIPFNQFHENLELKEVLSFVKTLSIEAQFTLAFIIYKSNYNASPVVVACDNSFEELLDNGIILKTDNPELFVSTFKRNELNQFLININVTGFNKNLSLENLILWVNENVENFSEYVSDRTSVIIDDNFSKYIDGIFRTLSNDLYSKDLFYTQRMI